MCDNHESALLEELDKLVQKDNELVSRISNARELMDNIFQDLGTPCHDTLKDLLNTTDPNLSEATAITRRGQTLYFNNKLVYPDLGEVHKSVYPDLGEVHRGEMRWTKEISVKISKSLNGTAPTPDGRMAVAYYLYRRNRDILC